MTTTDEILQAMKDAAVTGVASTSFSGGSSSQSAMSVNDQIAAIRFAKEMAAQGKNHGGLFFKQIVPCGARNDG